MRKWLIVLMAAVAIGATGILGWLYMRQDRKGPEITIAESKKNSYTSDMTTEDLLEGVKAVDDRDGDVSSSLTVENVYPNEKGDEVTVVYVAKDNSNNVTKVTYHMTSEGNLMGLLQKPKLLLTIQIQMQIRMKTCRMKMRLIQKMKKNQK